MSISCEATQPPPPRQQFKAWHPPETAGEDISCSPKKAGGVFGGCGCPRSGFPTSAETRVGQTLKDGKEKRGHSFMHKDIQDTKIFAEQVKGPKNAFNRCRAFFLLWAVLAAGRIFGVFYLFFFGPPLDVPRTSYSISFANSCSLFIRSIGHKCVEFVFFWDQDFCLCFHCQIRLHILHVPISNKI